MNQPGSMMLAEAYAGARYEISDGTGGDLELQRNGYLTLVRFRRWRAQTTNPAAVGELQQTMRAQKADHGMYITAGTIAESARKQAADSGIALVDGVALAERVRRTSGARKALARASEAAVKA